MDFSPPAPVAQCCCIPHTHHGQFVMVTNVYYSDLIMCHFGPDSNRNHSDSLLTQMDCDRGLDCLWGRQHGQLMLAKLVVEVCRTHVLLGKGQKAPLLSRESLKWEPSPITRHWRVNEGRLLCE